LNNFSTEKEGFMTEYELTGFLLSRTEMGEEYLQSFQIKADQNFISDNNFFNEDDNHNNIGEFNSKLTSDLKTNINKEEKIEITYKDYTTYTNEYKTKNDLKFTIPEPFYFNDRDDNERKMRRIEEIKQEIRRKEDEQMSHKFRANDLNRKMFIGTLGNVIEAERTKRLYRTERLKEKIVQDMNPFSFYERDEIKHKHKLLSTPQPPKFIPFRANPIPVKSQILMLDDIINRADFDRAVRVEERARLTYSKAKLPPRMEMHEKEKKKKEEEKDEKREHKRAKSAFKARNIPNYAEEHEKFYSMMESKKKAAKLTVPQPFTFHEHKVKNN
jgi:hypothetical protein